MAEYKHDFVDNYPYIVYTDVDTIVYSGKVDTSIDDVPGSGGGDETEYEIHSAFVTQEDESTVDIYEADESFVYKVVEGDYGWEPDLETGAVTKAKAGEILICSIEQRPGLQVTLTPMLLASELPESPASESFLYPLVAASLEGNSGLTTFAMPAQNAWALVFD